MKVRDFAKLYFGLLILHLAVIYRPESEALYLISKPALLFSLLAFFIHRTSKVQIGHKLPIYLALGASLLGDVLLMNSATSFFLLGMGAFAIAQISYTVFYLRQPLSFKTSWLILSLAIVAVAFWLLYNYIPLPGDLQPFVYVYALLLSLHLVWSVKMLSARVAENWWPVAGAFLFLTSDLLLAYGKFVEDSKYLHMAVMATYAFAQFGIAIGLLRYMLQNEKTATSAEVARKASYSGSTS